MSPNHDTAIRTADPGQAPATPADAPHAAAATALPPSANPASMVVAGVVSLGLGAWGVFGLHWLGPLKSTAQATWATVLLIGLLGAGMTLWDLLALRSYRHNLVPARRAPLAARAGRVLRKWLGLHLVLALIAAVYWVLQEYRAELYRPFFNACATLLPWCSLAALPYIAWVDARMAEPDDTYHRLGDALLAGRLPRLAREEAWPFALSWLVRGFFLPLMFGYAVRQVQALDQLTLTAGPSGWPSFRQVFELLFTLMYFIDVVWGVVGYLWTLRLTDSHVRSTDPSVAGWAVALMCYEPFSKGLWPGYFAYGSGKPWGAWLADMPLAYMAWGCAILALLAFYTWSTMAFGLRYGNLSHRGIVTNGPYRWLQHPAYVSKNLSWWLISMPFMVNVSAAESLRLCAMLLLVNGLYALRARTEERHLMADATYRAYATAMQARRARWLERLGAWRRRPMPSPAPAPSPAQGSQPSLTPVQAGDAG